MNCTGVQEKFSEYYDRELPGAERGEVEHHLRDCGVCAREYEIFQQSLDVLHKSQPIETTAVFVANVQAVAGETLQRREPYPPPAPEPRVEVRKYLPLWAPWVAAAAVVLAFLAGTFSTGQKETGEVDQLRKEIELLKQARRPKVSIGEDKAEITVADKERILAEYGLVREGGEWIPKRMSEDFLKGLVCMDGRMVSKEAAFNELVKTYGRKDDDHVAPVKLDLDGEMKKLGYVKVADGYVRAEWIERWQRGLIQVAADAWKTPEEFKRDFMKEHNLVEYKGAIMTKEQLEELNAQKTVRRPELATASNAITDSLDGLEIGPPLTCRNLTLYPVLAKPSAEEVPFTTLHATLDPERFELADTGQPFVVKAVNKTDGAVMLVAGEILVGGRYARVVMEDVLVPARKTVDVPVCCVEPSSDRKDSKFQKESGFYFAPGPLRRVAGADHGQGAIWTSLARQVDLVGGKPKSQAEVYRQLGAALVEFRVDFQDFPERYPDAIGVVVAIGDRVSYAELFLNHTVFIAYFDRVLNAAALEAELARLDKGTLPVPSRVPNDLAGARHVLEIPFFATIEGRGDDGQVLRKDGVPIGRGLLVRERPAHLLLFAEPGAPLDWRGTVVLPKDKRTRVFDAYEERIRTGGTLARTQAIVDLSRINVPEATAALARHLGDIDIQIRKAVILALAEREDPRVVPALVDILEKSRKETALFTVTATALARIGDEKAVEPFLKQLDGTDADLIRIILVRIPELVLQIKNRELLEKAVAKLITVHEDVSAGTKGDVNPTVTTKLKPAEAQAMIAHTKAALEGVTGKSFDSAAAWREWWNKRDNREAFLRERLGK